MCSADTEKALDLSNSSPNVRIVKFVRKLLKMPAARTASSEVARTRPCCPRNSAARWPIFSKYQ
eukprot:2814145-Pleurochrysis_carterae.AAC.1